MTRREMVAKLEALLERVRGRSSRPRLAAHESAPRLAAAPARLPEPAAAVVPERPAPVAAARPVSEPFASEPTVVAARPSIVEPPAPVVASPKTGAGPAEEAPVSDTFDSRERLVAAQPAPAAQPGSEPRVDVEIPVEVAAAAKPESAPPMEVGEAEIDVIAEITEDEEPPISSQRPVVPEREPEERLAQLAFGTEEPPPLHTPPPESGRLPSAPAEFDPDVTGVRHATPLSPRRIEPSPLAPPELTPVATHADLGASDAVAEIIAEAQRFAPSSFLALLEASLLL